MTWTNPGWWFLILFLPLIVSNVLVLFGESMLIIAGIFGLVGLVGAIVMIVWFCKRGTMGANQYGLDPLEGQI
jgi:uncharacterized membrane protein YhaH (DUF805 family)